MQIQTIFHYIIIFILLILVFNAYVDLNYTRNLINQKIDNFITPKLKGNVVIMSSSLNPRYLFLLPIGVASWHKVNVTSIIFLIGKQSEFESNKQSSATIKLLKEMGSRIIFYESKRLSPVSLSQLIRLFPAALPVSNLYDSDKTIFIISDADFYIFHLENHLPDLSLNKTVHLYNSRCCKTVTVPNKRGKHRVRMYPMATNSATINTWRSIMGFHHSNFTVADIEDYASVEFGPNFFHFNDTTKPRLVGSAIWYADQSLFGYKMDEWLKMPANNRTLSERIKPARRIDRARWPSSATFKNYTTEDWDDCHQLTAAFGEKEWPKYKPFLEFAFEDDPIFLERLVKYRAEFVAK